MNITNIIYPTALEKIVDPLDDNLDVIVELEDGKTYVVVVTTPQNLKNQMEKEGVPFIPASPPFIIVNSLTYDNILLALKTFANNDAYWLKLYHTAGHIELKHLENVVEKLSNQC